MKRHSIISRSLISSAALLLLAACLFWAQGSTAITKSPAPTNQDEKGTIVAQLKYDPAVGGYGFRNYGRDHDNENDLNAGNLVKIFGAENVCQSGTTASDCVLNEPAEEWLAECVKLLEGGHCEGLAVT